MEEKKKNLLDNTLNQPTKFRTKNFVETNDVVERVAVIVQLNVKLQC